jgi:uncharacterized membrane protein
MRNPWERWLQRWAEAGVVDAATAERIRAFEATSAERQTLRWPVLLAVSLGGLLVGAGVLLFVAAHWEDISPAARFALVLLLVAVFHAAGALLTERFAVLSTVLHAVGTATLGAGIFLAGQIFNLQEHWPGGLMLWAAGAWAGWWLLRDWVQAAFAALLTPAWLAGEWMVAAERVPRAQLIPTEGLLLLALTYLTARTAEQTDITRRALTVIGALYVIPGALLVLLSREAFSSPHEELLPTSLKVLGWFAALGLPLLLAVWLRGRAAWMNVVAAVWVVVLGTLAFRMRSGTESLPAYGWHELGPYVWCGLGSLGLVAWGLYEARKERINLGVAGFALTVLFFYFSTVMDKLGRAMSLIGGGVLFIVGGWALERTRRRLVARVKG